MKMVQNIVKKQYLAPAIEVVEVDTNGFMDDAVVSNRVPGGNGNGNDHDFGRAKGGAFDWGIEDNMDHVDMGTSFNAPEEY